MATRHAPHVCGSGHASSPDRGAPRGTGLLRVVWPRGATQPIDQEATPSPWQFHRPPRLRSGSHTRDPGPGPSSRRRRGATCLRAPVECRSVIKLDDSTLKLLFLTQKCMSRTQKHAKTPPKPTKGLRMGLRCSGGFLKNAKSRERRERRSTAPTGPTAPTGSTAPTGPTEPTHTETHHTHAHTHTRHHQGTWGGVVVIWGALALGAPEASCIAIVVQA